MVMETAVKEAFSSLGISFRTRNHAMRFRTAAPDVALCSQQIFGSDFDSIFVDFYDGKDRNLWGKALFFHRTATASKKYPIFFNHGRSGDEPLKIPTKLATMGLPILAWDSRVEKDSISAAPDSKSKPKSVVKQEFPINLQFFRCGGKSCADEIMDTRVCP